MNETKKKLLETLIHSVIAKETSIAEAALSQFIEMKTVELLSEDNKADETDEADEDGEDDAEDGKDTKSD